jgi:hypothetical protein
MARGYTFLTHYVFPDSIPILFSSQEVFYFRFVYPREWKNPLLNGVGGFFIGKRKTHEHLHLNYSIAHK